VESVTDRTSDFHFYGLIGTIEIQRHQSNNPPLPEWLEKDYYSAIQKCCDFAVKDYSNDLSKDVTQLILGFLALRKDDLQLAQILLGFSRSELLGAMEEYFGVLEQN